MRGLGGRRRLACFLYFRLAFSSGAHLGRFHSQTRPPHTPLHAPAALARQQGRLGAGGPGEVAALRLALPHSMDELRAVRRTVELYRQNYGRQLALLLGVAYLFLQVGDGGWCG